MESREVTAADGETTSLDDLCPGSDEQLRRCINWIGDVWHMVGNLVNRLANEHAAVNLSEHAYSFAIARSRDQAHFLIQQRQGAEDRLACLALQVSEHLLVPLIEITVACVLIDSSYQNVREEGMDRFCDAVDWWEREAKSAVELMQAAIEDRRRRSLGGDAAGVEGSPRATQKSDRPEGLTGSPRGPAMDTAGFIELLTLNGKRGFSDRTISRYKRDWGAQFVAGNTQTFWFYLDSLDSLNVRYPDEWRSES